MNLIKSIRKHYFYNEKSITTGNISREKNDKKKKQKTMDSLFYDSSKKSPTISSLWKTLI